MMEVREMKINIRSRSWTITFVLITLVSAISVAAQRPIPTFANRAPFDFSDKSYVNRGINPEAIIGRRTGTDGLSVFGKIADTSYTNVRVLVTIPAYNGSGEPMFWYPLGELMEQGFTDDKAGVTARQIAALYPIYVFPHPKKDFFNSFDGSRQAPIIDNAWSMYTSRELNPMGLRQLMVVNYTEKAFTKEGFGMMQYMGKKNGLAANDTPLVKSLFDIEELLKSDMITIQPIAVLDNRDRRGQFAISPIIPDPTKGAIAPDAFLWMATKGGTTLPSEQIFVNQFGCLQKTGDWCQ